MSSSCKKRLLIVGAFPGPGSVIVGGIITTCRVLLKSEISRKFHLVLIDSTQKSNPPPVFFIRLGLAIKRIINYTSQLIAKQPDAVLLFVSTGASVAEKGFMVWLARLLKTPVLLFPRGGELISLVQNNLWQRMWIRPALRGATFFLCQGSAWERFALADLGYSSERTKVIKNWTATPDLLEIGRRKMRSINLAKPRVLFLSWLEKEKGIFELLEACRSLSPNHNFMLTIAGRGHAEEGVRTYVKKHNLNPFIKMAGWVHGRKKIQLLAKTDILILPSWAEGFPNVIIEAMAAKVAVIVTAVGNVPDMLDHRKQALIIPPKDVESLTNALGELILDPGFRLQLAEKGFDYAQKHFSTAKGVKQLIAIIEAATSKSSLLNPCVA